MKVMNDEGPKLSPNGLQIGLSPENCKFCGQETGLKMRFHGPNFKYLKEGEVACAECWIEHVVGEAINKELP